MAQNNKEIDFSNIEKQLSEDIKLKSNRGRFVNYVILSFVKMNDFANSKSEKDFEEAKRYLNEVMNILDIK